MSYDIPELLESLIGLECISVRINMDNNITIDLNDRDLEEWSDEDKANKGWKLMTESCAWRIIKDSMILCGHYDDAEDIIPVLNELIGATVVEFKQISPYDLSLSLSKGCEIQFLSESLSDTIVSIYSPNNKYIAFESGNMWTETSSNVPEEELNKEEKLLDEHSERCFRRWSKVVNQVSFNRCSNCAYFLRLKGMFYFWDFGLCSNEASLNDGRVVGICSGCDAFKEELE
ncbi:MAG TPA: DUF3027 domain-containing protein [Defluviitaleaceae bacterium]|nr:DUF3027 domain-containing protein [Defluviitaleaceae bacterium]